ncbi:hypothetical protein [Mycobacteroides abscessus]|uniref:hypothetical protein n=1 Tax=Mycobacteroides abscessus TaxID=36809 RepID=UPI0005E2E0B6|nr:hypothetical protein [Mycobacteroides abscessus]CPS10162.1 Uncharacterised protein [Mycobacteroides abscessus]CPU99314.1 Uncharacterised protein [Mycobacteroides abscessus]
MSSVQEQLEAQNKPMPKCHVEWSFAYPCGEVACREEVGELTEAQARKYVDEANGRKLLQRTVTEWYEVE